MGKKGKTKVTENQNNEYASLLRGVHSPTELRPQQLGSTTGALEA